MPEPNDLLLRLELLEAKAIKLANAHKELKLSFKELQQENNQLKIQKIANFIP